MSVLRIVGAPLRRLPSDVAGQAVLTYAICACLFAAALVLALAVWEHGDIPADLPAAEESG